MERHKRVISKPLRYQTTSSSDESPKRIKSMASATITAGTIDKDIDHISRILEQENSTNFNIERNITYTDIQHNTDMQSDTDITSYTAYTSHTQKEPNTGHVSHTQTHTGTLHTPRIPTRTDPLYTPHTPTHTDTLHTPRTPTHTVTFCTSHTPTHTNTLPNMYQNKHAQNTQNFTLHTQSDKTYYTNEICFQPLDTRMTLPIRQNVQSHQHEEDERYEYHPKNAQMQEDMKNVKRRLSNLETEMKKMNDTLHKILQCVQDRHSAPQKPRRLPISTILQVDEFENVSEEDYSAVVDYFHYVGGFHLKEAINLCLKEAIVDRLTWQFTWFGREKDRHPLYNTRLVRAIYDAICRNKNFERPTRSAFQAQMRESLRVGKERHRSRIRPRQSNVSVRNEDLWKDDEDGSNENVDINNE